MNRWKAISLRKAIVLGSASLEDSVAQNVPELFPAWEPDAPYVNGARVQYNGVLYKVLQDHQSQETWTPDNSPSLFARVLVIDGEIKEWEQPDSTNPYMLGDKVTHNGKTWESLIDNNIWEPGALGTETLWLEIE